MASLSPTIDALIAATPLGGPALHAEIARRYAYTARDLTGVAELVAHFGGLAAPTIEWRREVRGTDAVTAPRLVIPTRLPGEGPIREAYRVAKTLVVLRHGRYRHATVGGARREARDRAEMARSLAVALQVWAPLALSALIQALDGEAWVLEYHWAQPYPPVLITQSLSSLRADRLYDEITVEGIDPSGPHLSVRPITAASHRIATRERDAVDTYVAVHRQALLAVTLADVERSAARRLPAGTHHIHIHVNRPSYLAELAGIDVTSRFVPRGVCAAIEADPAIRAHAQSLRETLIAEGR